VIITKSNLGVDWAVRISSISLLTDTGLLHPVTTTDFREFLQQRCRQWEPSEHPANTPIACPSSSIDTNTNEPAVCLKLSGGKVDFPEQILLKLPETILDWQNQVAQDPDYANPEYSIHNINMEQMNGKLDMMVTGGQPAEDDGEIRKA
jgi:hypothetical protein